MCGICGKLNHDGVPVEEALLRKMAGSFSYRGPDDEGYYANRPERDEAAVGLGHRRLSIIDLSAAGRQPMTNEDGSVRIVFNGEIYNFQALRTELERKGHRFRSKTDTEVIVHLYEEEGADGFRRLSGMFAFAIWDERAQSLLLCRDRIGIKPLVYGKFGSSFLFASEIKGILEDPEVPREIDWNALDLYLTFNYIPAPFTIFRGIRKLRPGHCLVLKDGKVFEKAYWNIPDRTGERTDYEAAREELYRTLEDAVRSHMISDVPLGAFLSGGIDSSIIVGLMARNSGRPVKTFSIGYADMPLFDETGYAAEVAAFHGTDHHVFKLGSRDIRAAIPRVLESFDEPFADSSAVPTFIVSRETAGEVKVALSGDGGDELFAGYRMYTGEGWYARYRRIPGCIRRGVIEPAVLALPDSRNSRMLEYARRAKKFLRGAKGSFAERFFSWNEIFSQELREAVFPSAEADRDLGKAMLAARLRETDGDPINRMLYADLKESLPGDMLRKVDLMSMLHSLEVRVPLLDHRVCELAFAMPGDWKIRNGRGKHILIDTFKELLPPSLHRRPKWGFEMPVSQWLKTDLAFLIEEHLSRERLARQGIFRYEAVRGLREALQSNRSDTGWQLWNLIVFQVWYANFMEQ
ncbi:MAG: Asparagine synthetase (glutamine-hydrolyzing) 1 [Syntrophaceae bacterium PtaU1.Bin231]|nr:MAG: Asparagine synthetase (glutamine-hydrolyzing) 1 [Syntrophaceae bacterium PtaU1.Bin231]